jgi:hypothetical protein
MAFLTLMFLVKESLTSAQWYSFTIIGGVAGVFSGIDEVKDVKNFLAGFLR